MILVGVLSLALLLAGGSDGTLRVKTDVAGVKVFVDDQEAGETPLTITPVAAGRHRVTLLKAGYQDHVEEVEVQAGATTRLFVVMKPSEISLPAFPVQYRALHQHSSGACIGQLTVTADAVDYRSDDGHDVFHLPIREMRSVARSMGSRPFGFLEMNIIVALTLKYKVAVTACRIEVPGRGYGFWAVESDAKTLQEVKSNEAIAEKTKELFEVVYRLWTTSLKSEKKPAEERKPPK